MIITLLDILCFHILFRIQLLHCLFISILFIYKRMMHPKVCIIKIDCWQNFRPKSVSQGWSLELSLFLDSLLKLQRHFQQTNNLPDFPEKDNSGPLRIACFTHVLPQIEPLWKWSHPHTPLLRVVKHEVSSVTILPCLHWPLYFKLSDFVALLGPMPVSSGVVFAFTHPPLTSCYRLIDTEPRSLLKLKPQPDLIHLSVCYLPCPAVEKHGG